MSNQAPIAPEVIPYSDENMKQAIGLFKAKKIPTYEPGEDDYERYIATANLIYRFSSPPCVVQPKCACDVRDIIRIAKPRKIPITIKNGGHSYAGGTTANIGILMELGLMNEVNLDMKSQTLVSNHIDGYVVNGGRCPTVGVSGFMLGGGLSPFTRSFGMGCDTVKEFSIVTADGDEVTVSERDDPKSDKGKLFWALRGAGGGNFGVVVEMKLAVQKLRSDLVVAGRYTWFPDRDEKIMEGFMTTMNAFYTRKWSNEMTLDSSCCAISPTPRVISQFGFWSTTMAADKTLTKRSTAGPCPEPRTIPGRTRRAEEAAHTPWIEETKKSFPSNRSYQIYTSFVFKNGRKTIEGITKVIREEMKAFREQFAGESGLMQVTFIHSGGAANDNKERKDTAFRWRGCLYNAYIMIQWDEKWLEMNMRGFLNRMKPKLSPFGMVQGATFINFPDGSFKADAHEKSYYGNNHQELRRVKALWDKDNYFKWSQGIQLPVTKEKLRMAVSDNEENGNVLEELVAADELVVDEEALTDALAEQQWESYRPSTPASAYGGGALPTLVTV
ncbi:hypothetical protein ACJZ2D_011494 [Fusarium nematophilum]